MPIMPCTVVTFIADKGFTGVYDHGSFVTVIRDDVAEGTALHFPFTHPQLPAPQSIGPSQLIVHIRLHTPLFALLVQLVGWQHWAGTHSSSVMQLCGVAEAVVTTGTGVWVGDTVTTGGLPEVHPLTIIRQAVTIRTRNTKPEVLPAMVPDISGDMIIIWWR
jgi:hypothetical protein